MDLLAHLESYIAVAEESSFSKAADRLYVAQPVLSRRIKTLERHLGGELFDRSRRQITSTDLGLLLLPYAKDVLSRVDHLRKVAAVARDSATLTVGVPPDSDPPSLARIIHAGSQRGMTIRVQELSAEERANRLTDGSLAVALLRMPPESAARQVPLGLASARPMNGSSGRRPVHLEDLRPRRGARGVSSPVILVTAEDQMVFAAHRFDKAIARAGLPATRVRRVEATATVVAETLAGHAMLLCAKPFAQRHDLAWAPLADTALHRGYELSPAGHGVSNGETLVLDWLEPLLAAAVGAVGGSSNKRGTADAATPRPRLAAHG